MQRRGVAQNNDEQQYRVLSSACCVSKVIKSNIGLVFSFREVKVVVVQLLLLLLLFCFRRSCLVYLFL